MNIFLFLISSLIFLACTESPEDYAKSLTIKTSPSTAIKVKRPMKFGDKLACKDWIDLDSLEKAFAMPLTLKDESAKKKETSSSCSIRNNQKRPKKTKKKLAQQKATKADQILGVTPGDEFCLTSLYCSYVSTENSLKKRCTQEQDEETTIAGQFACVHKTQRGSRWAYTYRTIDPDTTCMLTIQGGPSVTDETTVRTCTYFALKHLTKESLTQQASSNTDQKQ